MKTCFWGPINPTFAANSKKPLKLVCLALLVWPGTHENTAFGTKQILPSQHDVSSVNPKKQLKLVCLALVWLGAHENTALGTNKGRRLKKQISRLPYFHCFQGPVGHAGLTRWVAVG